MRSEEIALPREGRLLKEEIALARNGRLLLEHRITKLEEGVRWVKVLIGMNLTVTIAILASVLSHMAK